MLLEIIQLQGLVLLEIRNLIPQVTGKVTPF